MNPLLGVGAVALAASVLAGANALANRDTANIENLGVPKNLVTDYGTYTAPEFKVDQYKGESFMGTLPKPGASSAAKREILGAGSAEELTRRLEQISKDMSELTFRMTTGGISDTTAQAELKALKAEMAVLTKQAQSLPQTNIYISGAIDPEGTARQVAELQNNSYYRGGGGGANALVFP
jgi:hypothetical protein